MPTLEPRAPLDPIGGCVRSQHSLKEGGDFGPEEEDGGVKLRGRGRPAWMQGPVGRRCSAEGTPAPRECTPHWGPGTLPDLQVAVTPGDSARPHPPVHLCPFPLPSQLPYCLPGLQKHEGPRAERAGGHSRLAVRERSPAPIAAPAGGRRDMRTGRRARAGRGARARAGGAAGSGLGGERGAGAGSAPPASLPLD